MLTSGSITENGGSELQDGLRRTDKNQLLKAVTYRDGPFDLVGGGVGGKRMVFVQRFFLGQSSPKISLFCFSIHLSFRTFQRANFFFSPGSVVQLFILIFSATRPFPPAHENKLSVPEKRTFPATRIY